MLQVLNTRFGLENMGTPLDLAALGTLNKSGHIFESNAKLFRVKRLPCF